MKVSYEWLQTFFDEGALPSVAELEEVLLFHAYEIEGVEEVGTTSVIDVDVLPNRAADSLSHRGIAREISTLLNIPMRNDVLRNEVDLLPTTDTVSVSLEADASCTYYAAVHITDVTVGESPDWLKARLAALGQKSINNVVDATNYVLFGLGQPTHVFDAAKFTGTVPHIGVRRAKQDEKIVLLGGAEISLQETMSVITDAASDTAIAVAGVKGGSVAEVTAETTDIVIESAKFDPVQTRKTSQVLKLRTDASARFENDVPDVFARYGAYEVAQLILEIAGGELVGYVERGEMAQPVDPITITAERVSKLLGAEISQEEIEAILTRIGCLCSREGDVLRVTPPLERRDITIPEHVIEEVGRVYGYNKIESVPLPMSERAPRIHKKFAYSEIIRNTLTELGGNEVYLYSLRDSGEIALRNALASDKDHLRSNLREGLLEVLDKGERNMPLLGLYESVFLFEIGNVFLKSGEETHVGIGVRVAGTKKREARTAEVMQNIKDALEQKLGTSLPEIEGETFECNLDALIETLPEVEVYPDVAVISDTIAYKTPSQYPFVLRDVAVWTPEGVATEEITEIVTRNGGVLLKRNDLFDTFSKEGRTSHAFHLVFQSERETLTDGQIGVIMAAIEQEFAAKEGWEVR